MCKAQVIAEHLYREGLFDIGDTFVAEAQISDGNLSKLPFMEMRNIMKQVSCMCKLPLYVLDQYLRSGCMFLIYKVS